MKHAEPEAKVSPKLAKEGKTRKPTHWLAGLLAAAALVGGGGYGLGLLWSPSPVDRLSDEKKAQLVTQFTKLDAIPVKRIDPADVSGALDSMRLEPAARQALKSSLAVPATGSPPAVLVELLLWDFATQDGDIVKVSSAGYQIEVPLLNAPTTVVVPVDGTQTIELSGTRDGGGGITVGIQIDSGMVSLPVIAPNQALKLPVRF